MSNDKEFNEWFNGLLLFDKSSCTNRDILRWAKPVLKHGWGYQLYSDLEYKGSQEFINAWLNKTLEPQNNELKKIIEQKNKEIERLKNALRFYADKENWSHYDIHSWGVNTSSIKGQDAELLKGTFGYKGTEYYGGKRARQALSEVENE